MNKYIILLAILLCISSSYALITTCGTVTGSVDSLNNSINAYGNETCLTIDVSPFTLNMNGYTIYNASNSSTSIAIYVNGSGIVISNGVINNSRYGIYVNNSGSAVTLNNITFNDFNSSYSYGVYLNNITGSFTNLAFRNFTESYTYGIYANNVSVCTFTNLSFTNYNYSYSYGFYANNITNSVLRNLTFTLGAGGFFLTGTGSNNNTIMLSTAQQVYAGFVTELNTNNTRIVSNTVNNSDVGFSINGNYTNLSRNNVTYSHLGIYLKTGSNQTLTNNNLSNNYQNVHADIGVFPITTLDNTNTVDGKTLYYDGACSANLNVDSTDNIGVLWLANCNKNITVGNMSFEYESQPILFFNHTGSVAINNVTINNSAAGILYDLNYENDITFYSSNPSSPSSFDVKNSVIGNQMYIGGQLRDYVGYGIYLYNVGVNVTTNISNNNIRSNYYGLYLSSVSGSNSMVRNNTFTNNIYRSVYGSSAANFAFEENNISYDGNTEDLPSTVNNRPTTIRFAQSSLGGSSPSGSSDSPTYDCKDDLYIYPPSSRYGFYLTGGHGSISGFSITNTNVSGMSIGYYISDITNSNLSNLLIQNANESIYIYNGVNLTLSNITSFTNPAQTMSWPQCHHYYDLRLYSTTTGVVLDHVSINGTVISANLSNLNYTYNIVFDAENLPSTAPTGSWTGESANITLYYSLPNQSSSGTKNTTVPLNFTMYYDPSGFTESSFVPYEWNGSDWISLSSNATQNESGNNFNFSLLGVHSTYSFFAQETSTSTPDDDDNHVNTVNSLSIAVSTSCDDNVITVTSDGEPVSGARVVLTSLSTNPNTYSYLEYYSPNANSLTANSISNIPSTESVMSVNTITNTVPTNNNGNYEQYTPRFVDGVITLGTTDSNGRINFDGCGQTLQAYVSKSDYSSDSTTFTEVNCDRCFTPATNTFECTTNNDCPANQQCSNSQCIPIACDCGFISNHQCIDYQCCSASACGTNEVCTDHICVKEESKPECTVDSDCPDDSICVDGSCKPLVGCGEIANHAITLYQCGSGEGCPSCPVGTCIEHVCFVGDVSCESGRVGEQKTCEFTQSQTPCSLCDYQLIDPDGKVTTGKTRQDGKLSVSLTNEGVYKVALLKDGKVIKVANLVATPKLSGDEPTKQILSDLTKFIWIPIVLLLLGIFTYIVLGHLAKKHKK